jgi:hypothetical protein
MRYKFKKWFDNLEVPDKTAVVYFGGLLYIAIVATLFYYILKG